MRYKRILVTGGSGFIGSAFIRYGLKNFGSCEQIVNLDSLTYAAHPDALKEVEGNSRYHFVKGDIRDEKLVEQLCSLFHIDAIMHFAAETHVDRSIVSPKLFAEVNVLGTLSLLEVVRKFPHIHFHHVSTDEVYGSLREGSFNEASCYAPSSAYSASKAASDHFVKAYGITYGISYTVSHCSNNYGPYQHTEKLIPRLIEALKRQEPLPLYGTGENVRDWLFVEDHVEALWLILEHGVKGRVYDIGGGCEKTNREVADLLMEMFGIDVPIVYVDDRPGHDFRYAIDSSRIREELGWAPKYTLIKGLETYVSR
ncbi:MAG: dTDP-glucose 4,6-dehydratase [Chlamydiota bacterium]|jgi:dTDP-glucose 4,6-dehydratase